MLRFYGEMLFERMNTQKLTFVALAKSRPKCTGTQETKVKRVSKH